MCNQKAWYFCATKTVSTAGFVSFFQRNSWWEIVHSRTRANWILMKGNCTQPTVGNLNSEHVESKHSLQFVCCILMNARKIFMPVFSCYGDLVCCSLLVSFGKWCAERWWSRELDVNWLVWGPGKLQFPLFGLSLCKNSWNHTPRWRQAFVSMQFMPHQWPKTGVGVGSRVGRLEGGIWVVDRRSLFLEEKYLPSNMYDGWHFSSCIKSWYALLPVTQKGMDLKEKGINIWNTHLWVWFREPPVYVLL